MDSGSPIGSKMMMPFPKSLCASPERVSKFSRQLIGSLSAGITSPTEDADAVDGESVVIIMPLGDDCICGNDSSELDPNSLVGTIPPPWSMFGGTGVSKPR